MAISSSTSSATGTASVSGLISGLDTDGIIAKMVQFAQKPIQIIQDKQTTLKGKLAAWQDMNTRLLALKTNAVALSNPSSFQNKSSTVSDPTAMAVVTNLDAAPGTYLITINKLAQAEQRQTQGYGDTDSTTIGTGTLKVGVGNAAKSITIDSTNNTLGGIKDAINHAGVGITAAIVDYGSQNTHDYHLQLTSNSTGESNGIAWDTSGLTGGTPPAWTTLTAAQDASITVGPTGNTTTIKKSTNTISDIYPGLTLSLKAADVSKQVTLTVSSDTSAIKNKIQNFIGQYNDVMDNINSQFSFDSDSNTSGTLFGDNTLQGVEQDLRDKVLDVIPGLSSGMNTLSQIGITSDTKDHLVLNEADLDNALAANPDGVTKLFADSGTTSNQSVQFVSGTNNTKDTGSTGGYTVRVDQPATQSRLTGGAAQTSNLTADEVLTVNGTAINLTSGMTPQQVVDEINKRSASTGVTASHTTADGTGTGDYLTLTRNAYGSGLKITAASTVSNGAGTPATDTSGIGKQQVTESLAGGETGSGTGNAGVNVSGAFGKMVNGVTSWEAAVGSGQQLSGNPGNASTDGLKVKITATAAGQYGQVSYTRGIASSMNNLLDFLTNTTGAVTTSENSLTKEIADLQTEIDTQNQRVTDYSDQVRTKFNSMEALMGQLQSQGNYLNSQFAAMNKSK